MKSATTIPTQPSIIRPLHLPTSIAASTAAVETVSDSESIPVATIAAELIFLPMLRL